MNRVIVLLIAVAIMAYIMPVYGQEATQEQAVYGQEATPKAEVKDLITGQVVSVDLEKSVLVVKKMNTATNLSEEVNVQVLPETKIVKDDVTIKLSDLKAEEQVTVEYKEDEAGNLQAQTITLQ